MPGRTLPGSVRGSRPAARGLVLGLVAAALTACSGGGGGPVPGAHPDPTPSVHVLPLPAQEVVRAAPVATATADTTYRRAVDGTLLPDRETTPGVSFPDVTREDVCTDRYASTVRNPRYGDKVEVLEAYGLSPQDREVHAVDHLVPVELGGTNAPGNLWPQPRQGEFSAEAKDRLEAHLVALVCSGTVPLAEAQAALADDWRAAHDRYLPVPAPHVQLLDAPAGGAGQAAGAVVLGAACTTDGELGRWGGTGPKLLCAPGGEDGLRWSRRY